MEKVNLKGVEVEREKSDVKAARSNNHVVTNKPIVVADTCKYAKWVEVPECCRHTDCEK